MNLNKKELVAEILKIAEDIVNAVPLGIPLEYLNSDMTVAQLRILLVLQTQGPSRMGSIASITGVTLPTATGVVENLVRKELVIREKDFQDRRLVICKLSPEGQELINKLWTSGRFQMENLLDGLTLDQLEKAREVAHILLGNVVLKNPGDSEGGGL